MNRACLAKNTNLHEQKQHASSIRPIKNNFERMKKSLTVIAIVCLLPVLAFSQNKFNGLDMNMGNLYRLSDAKTRSISPENFSGEKGKAGMADPADKDKPNTANAF